MFFSIITKREPLNAYVLGKVMEGERRLDDFKSAARVPPNHGLHGGDGEVLEVGYPALAMTGTSFVTYELSIRAYM